MASKISLSTKIHTLSLAATVILAGLVWAIYNQFESITQQFEIATKATTMVRQQMEADMAHDAIRADVFMALVANNPQDLQIAEKTLKEHTQSLREMLEANEPLAINTPAAEPLHKTIPLMQQYAAEAQAIVAKTKLTHENTEATTQDLSNFSNLFKELENAMDQLTTLIERSVSDIHEQTRNTIENFVHLLWIGLIGAIGILFILSSIIAWSVPKPFKSLANKLSELTFRLNHSADEFSKASQNIADSASQQAASLEETSASLEEITTMISKTAQHAQSASNLAQETQAAAEQGLSDMAAMDKAMCAIKESSNNIAKIIKTIDEIAFQTKILALNAAVEAARAGEAGAGFAVVADEVRNLAGRSAQAAAETAEKIEDSIAKSNEGVAACGNTASRLNTILEKARKTNEFIADIATATQEQSIGIQQTTAGVGDIDRVTQANAASAEETASVAQEFSRQIDQLKDSTHELLVLSTGNQSRENSVSAPEKSLLHPSFDGPELTFKNEHTSGNRLKNRPEKN